jgi:diadenosine tetraphosphate (Ap4A) HIT family hydrolase
VSDGSQWKCDGSDLCGELAGIANTEFSRTYDGDPPSRRLRETRSFAMVVDISPLTEGHLLVVPKSHYLNFATAMLDHREEAAQLLDSARAWVRETYGAVTLFEHGSTADETGGACIAHAHVHVLPVEAAQVVALMRRDGLELLDNVAWSEIARARRPYLLCSDGDRSVVAFPPARTRHQYLRSAAGQVLGIPDPEWDWSIVVRGELLRDTIRRYRGAIDSAA